MALMRVTIVLLLLGITVNAARRNLDNENLQYKRWHLMVDTTDDETDSIENEETAPHSRNRQYTRTRDSLKQLIRQGYEDWETFKKTHGKQFREDTVEKEHMLAFLAAQQHIRRHNDAFERGETTFKLGINHIADLPYSDYQKLNGYRRIFGDSQTGRNSSRWLAPMNVEIPESVDWRTKGLVTGVKNQGMCGSCWAFSSTGSLEGQHARSTGKLISLSEQNLVDCSTKYGNNGCNGGLMDFAFQYIKENHGIDTEDGYPYKGVQKKCHFKKAVIGADDTGFIDLPEGDEHALKIAVATQGPISVAIDAGHRSFQMYKEGVYYEKQCSSEMLDHGVLIVGYGTDPEHGDYWIIKNSWGESWGEKGYVRIARNKNNHCGVATKASYPLV